METRSRKRVEAEAEQRPVAETTKRGAPRPKQPRLSSSPLPPRHRFSTRASQNLNMDSTVESSTSASKRDSKQGQERDEERSGSGKGKDKEIEKERARDRANESDNVAEVNTVLQSNLASASSALHGLLRKLGAGLDDILPSSSPSSHQSSRLKRILSGLRAEREEGRQLEALTQLCELLSIGTEDSLGSFSVDSFVPLLVNLLNYDSNADMMLLAARALTHLCDVLPSSSAAVVHYGAVPSLCARLLTFEYIDLAEQSLQALEKISHEHPTACLRAGALAAVLSFLDFFSTGVQRVAVSTAANICRQLPSDASDFVVQAIPILTNLLQYSDSKVVEHACVCLTRIVESFASSPEKLDSLCIHGLIDQAARLISVSNSVGGMVPQASLSNSTYTGLIRLLSICACGSAAAAEGLHHMGISSILKDILTGSGLVSSISASPSSVNRPADQLYEIVTLVNELLPPMPQSIGPPNVAAMARSTAQRHSTGSCSTKVNGVGSAADVSSREKLLQKEPELLVKFGMDLFPVLIQVYGSSVNPPVRQKCLAAICKLVHFSDAEILRSLLKELNISSFLSGVLASKDPSALLTALQIAEMLMQKLPDVFRRVFVKEGVVHAIDALIASEQGVVVLNPGSSGKTVEGSSSSSRSRRGGRRRSSGETGQDDSKVSSSVIGFGSPPTGNLEASVHVLRNGLRSTAICNAKHFKETHFPADSGIADAGLTESLSKLKSLCAQLNGDAENTGKPKGKGKSLVSSEGQMMFAAVSEILSELSKGDGVSTFEFIGSGVVGSLLNYLLCGCQSKENAASLSSDNLRQQALKGFKLFIEVALPYQVDQKVDVPMAMLVRKLQDALSSVERFPVILSQAPRMVTGSASVTAGLSALVQPFKLRLCRAAGEKTLRDYSSNIVLIDPLANLASIEEFLWPRVQRESAQKSSVLSVSVEGNPAPTTGASASSAVTPPVERRSTRSRTLGSSRDSDGNKDARTLKGKGKVGTQGTPEDHKGPETRNAAARRRAAAGSISISRHSPGDSAAPMGSEDEDVEASPIDLDEAIAIEEDDSSDDGEEDEEHEEVRLVFGEEPMSICLGERVHDVRLGEGMDSGASASTSGVGGETRGPGTTSGLNLGGRALLGRGSETGGMHKNTLSFAAAAMAGLASGSGKGLRACRDRRSVAALVASNSSPKLSFFLNGKPLNRSLTILQAVQRQVVADEDDEERYASPETSVEGRRLWEEVYTIAYQRADPITERVGSGSLSSSSVKLAVQGENKTGSADSGVSNGEKSFQQSTLLDSILQGELPCDMDKSNATYNVLLLLRVLEGLNRLAPRLRAEGNSNAFAEGKTEINNAATSDAGFVVPQVEFLSSKLTPKLARQMQDAVALCSGGLPAWCAQLTRACPFLFPFETRRQYFNATAFGLTRALQRLQQQQIADNPAASNEREVRVGRLKRQKVRVSRNHILESAAKVMELYSGHKAILEVEYFGEVGTGLGPTLEFYTLLSHELQRTSLNMWRTSSTGNSRGESHEGDIEMQVMGLENVENSDVNIETSIENEEFVYAPQGLFPCPWPPSADPLTDKSHGKLLDHFRLLGRTIAKAIQDGRLLDLPLSKAFFKLMLGQDLDLYDIRLFDPQLGCSLQEMHNIVRRKKFLESTSDRKNTKSSLLFHNSKIEDLCLEFTLPGYPTYLLKPGGSNIGVTLDNLEEYVALVVDATVKSGITAQMDAFRSGFNQVFQLSSLQIFTDDELDYLICGQRELWVPETVAEHIKFDHGYTSTSPPIRHLLEVMGEFTPQQQQLFLRFVTGAPRLPPGGLAALNPKLTIVRKHPMGLSGAAAASTHGSTPPGNSAAMGTTLADGDLPSVMTCANYLKLPPYSSKEVMRERLLYAISEGQGSFDLS